MTGNGLFGSTTLDVAIGLIFVYLLLAIICTTTNEWIAGLLNTRANTLRNAIRQLLDGQAGQPQPTQVNWFLHQFYEHPLIAGMRRQDKKDAHPAYISARTFATTVMDIATRHKPGVIEFADLQAGIDALPDGDVKKALLSLIQNSNQNLAQAQKNIEAWYNDTMERVSGWYKRKTQLWTVIVATILVLCANADTVQITKTLWRDPTLRAQLVEQAKNRTTPPGQTSVSVEYTDKNNPLSPTIKPVSKDELSTLGNVVGWSRQSVRASVGEWADRILGWFLTIVAVSLGAPFWFDLLNKFMRVRNGGDAPEEMPTAPQKPQPPAPAPVLGKATN